MKRNRPSRVSVHWAVKYASVLIGPIVAVAVIFPWLLWPTGQVTGGHVIHWTAVDQWVRTWQQGGWWPAYLEEANAGLGSFWPVYYPPLYHCFCAIGVFLGLTYWHAAWTVVAAADAVGACLCYGWLRSHLPRRAALWGTLAYCLAPYRFLDIYYRGAFPEAAALQLLPGVLWAGDLMRKEWRWRAVLLGSIAFGVIVLCNLPATTVGLYGTFIYLATGACVQRNIGSFLRGLAVPLGGLALTAFFWVPAWMDRLLVALPFTAILVNPTSARFITLCVFGDMPADIFAWCAHCLLLAMLFLALAGGWRLHKPQTAAWLSALLLAAAGITLSTDGAAWLYRLAPLLGHIQFPWRCLGMVAPGMALLAGQAAFAWKSKPWTAWGGAAISAAALAVFWCECDLLLPDDLPAQGRHVIRNYVPVGSRLPHEDQAALPAIARHSGTVDFQVLSWEPGERIVATRAQTCFSLFVCTYADGRWKVYDQDDQPLETTLSPDDLWNRLVVEAPAPTSRIVIKLESTSSTHLGKGITVVAIASLPCFIWYQRRRTLPYPPRH